MPKETKKHIYYVQAQVTVNVTLKVVGTNKQEAHNKAADGAWHGVQEEDWDHAEIVYIGSITEGPGINAQKN